MITLGSSDTAKPGQLNLTADNVWIDLRHMPERFEDARPALFLDRDGVIVVDTHYLRSPDDVLLLPGASDLIAAANRVGIPVIVVTNQSGIGRGYFNWAELEAVQDKISRLLAEGNARWDAVFACPHHSHALTPYIHPSHPCRKPNPGMIDAARDLLNIDPARSWIIGDKAGDLEAGRNAGLMGGVHVATHPTKAVQELSKSEGLQTDQFSVLSSPGVENIWETLSYAPVSPV